MIINGAKTFNQFTKTLDGQKDGYVENNLKPITLIGTIASCTQEVKFGQISDHKLLLPDGREYFFVSNNYWKNILACHVGDEVKVKGLLNSNCRVLYPQLICRYGPFVNNENPIGLTASRAQKLGKKIGKYLNELVIMPAGLLVIFMAF